jgi:hypothetical protein
MDEPDYLQIYDLEDYLLETVRPRFHEQGYLNAFDFFCIVIWKANRSKSKIAKRLLTHCQTVSLEEAVRVLTSGLFAQFSPQRRMRYLWSEWGFLLPMASAILTILYPDDFTVYDIRVCNMLGKFHDIGNTSNFDKLWAAYVEFRDAVAHAAPMELSLREKDRYLWGKSFAQQLTENIGNGFIKGDDDAVD